MDMDPKLWGTLQLHIDMANVFAKLPFRQFFQARAVCKEWNRLASNGKFLEANARPQIPKPYFCWRSLTGYSSVCLRGTLYTYSNRWGCIKLYDLKVGTWKDVALPLEAVCCHLGVWQDAVYAVTPNLPARHFLFEATRRVCVHALREGGWEEVARIPDDFGEDLFGRLDVNVDAEARHQYPFLCLEDDPVEACFCEQYVQITVFLQDYHRLGEEGHRY